MKEKVDSIYCAVSGADSEQSPRPAFSPSDMFRLKTKVLQLQVFCIT